MSPPTSSSSGSPLHALQASLCPPASSPTAKPRLLVAGATGVLGNAVLRRLVGSGRFVHTEVLASEPMTSGLSQIGIALAGASSFLAQAWLDAGRNPKQNSQSDSLRPFAD